MNKLLAKFDSHYFFLGRFLLGLYFLVPGVLKVLGYESTLATMELKSIPFAALLLPITIAMQIALGLSLIHI